MAWIEVKDPKTVMGRLKGIYAGIASADGQIDHVLQVHSLRPRTLEGHLALYKAVMHSPSELSPRERELVGIYVSHLNGCAYCVKHHLVGLVKAVDDPGLAEHLFAAARNEGDRTHLSVQERAMLVYTSKLTRMPMEMDERDIIHLRDAGMSDAAILDLNQVVAYFAYANRTVLGLGVEIAGEKLGLSPSEGDVEVRHD